MGDKIVNIDQNSGFCFGVVYAVEMAEENLKEEESLYCLGLIVHNNEEVKRLEKKGLINISFDEYKKLKNKKVLIRAHGEPPETYKVALENNITLIDASCPVVLKLQNRIKKSDVKETSNTQIVIYGQEKHAETIGLKGQVNRKPIIISKIDDLEKINYTLPLILYSQTTKSTKGFVSIIEHIKEKYENIGKDPDKYFEVNNTLCRQVSNREPQLKKFSKDNDVVIFVAGKNSSNGKSLFKVCLENNSKCYYVSTLEEINTDWFTNTKNVGITGATSTPQWLIKKVSNYILSN